VKHAGEWVEIAEYALVRLVGGCLREAGCGEHEQAHKGEDQLDSLQGQLLKVVNSIETWPGEEFEQSRRCWPESVTEARRSLLESKVHGQAKCAAARVLIFEQRQCQHPRTAATSAANATSYCSFITLELKSGRFNPSERVHMKRALGSGLWLLLMGIACSTGCSRATPPQDFAKALQERLISAKPGDVIEVPEGKFHIPRTLSLTVNGVTLRGKGQDKSILSFAGQQSGAQGVLVKANDFTIEGIGIEDTAGDALTIQGGNNIIVRGVRTEWTRGPNETNGPYGIYPVECKNLLVEDSIAKGAADAGIYVGQSENVVIRRNRSEYNVDGYEIENTENVDAYENVATHNAGGMGVFNLPNLPKQGGKHVRVYENQLIENNTPNFAPKSLGPIYYLPTGTGLYVMAIRDVEVFHNKIQNNNTVNAYIINYKTGVDETSLRGTADSPITQQIFAPEDKRYDPFVQFVYFHDNDISGGGQKPDERVDGPKQLAAALGGTLPDLLYDGVVDPRWGRKGPNAGQVCFQNNGGATFLNFDAAGGMKRPVKDIKVYDCALPALTAVNLPSAGGGAASK
jgi:parallel beta-helix repeat protein